MIQRTIILNTTIGKSILNQTLEIIWSPVSAVSCVSNNLTPTIFLSWVGGVEEEKQGNWSLSQAAMITRELRLLVAMEDVEENNP